MTARRPKKKHTSYPLTHPLTRTLLFQGTVVFSPVTPGVSLGERRVNEIDEPHKNTEKTHTLTHTHKLPPPLSLAMRLCLQGI